MVSAENDPRPVGTIWTLNLDEPVPGVTPLVPVTFRRAGPDLLPTLVLAMEGLSSEELLKRPGNGRRCYTDWAVNRIAVYGWVSFEEEDIGELNLCVMLPGE